MIKIYNIKIFDPACGSGNFLVISFKELYLLEIKILEKINQLDENNTLLDNTSCINLKQFYGIPTLTSVLTTITTIAS